MSETHERRGIVIDTSAVTAILLEEPGSTELIDVLEKASTRLMAAPTRVELGIVVEARFGPAAADVVPRFIRDADVDVQPFDGELADRALGAWRRYGKGRHKAGLNLGDCFVYALAERTGYPVLCIGDDFAATDLDLAR